MGDPTTQLFIKIDAPDMNDNELEDLARLLREDIEALDVDSVEPVKGGEVPDGAMAGEWLKVGSFIVKLAKGVIGPVAAVVDSWLRRQNAKRIETSTDSSIKIKFRMGQAEFTYESSKSNTESIIKELENQVSS